MCDQYKPVETIRRDNLVLRIFIDTDAENPMGGGRLGCKSELKAWKNGEVYGFEVWQITTCPCCGKDSEELINSCWGFYGSDHKETGLLQDAGFYPLLPIEETYLSR